MNIVLVTNTYLPHVGGVARSVEAFREEYLKRGHRVLVVAPDFPGTPEHESDVIRIPAIQNFNASDFSVALPVPAGLRRRLDEFRPDIIHSQHPFLLGMTAVRIARSHGLPLVFTHHTLYERYTHYVPGDSPIMQRFVIKLATHYANICDQVFAPSKSISDLLIKRGVNTPVLVVPTGVYPEKFAHGNGKAFRKIWNIPEDAFVIGYVGRLAPEKNLEFLAGSVAAVLQTRRQAYFLVVGAGPSGAVISKHFSAAGVEQQVLFCGILEREQLADALAAMNIFAFSSRSETQGMVLIEAMAAGLPVVALDAPGAREVITDRQNGRLVQTDKISDFVNAMEWLIALPAAEMQRRMAAARETASAFSMPVVAEEALACYASLKPQPKSHSQQEEISWQQVMARIKAEWDIIRSLTRAGDKALSEGLSVDRENS
jgi:glycosyltransferase involved in cell wall biosynthesis